MAIKWDTPTQNITWDKPKKEQIVWDDDQPAQQAVQTTQPLYTPSENPGEQFAEQVMQGFINSAGAGLPEYALHKTGKELPEATGAFGRVGSGVGNLAGFMLGAPLAVGKGVAKIATKGLLKKAAKSQFKRHIAAHALSKGAISLGVASGLMTPKDKLFAPAERAKAFGSGAVTGMVFGGMSYVPWRATRMLGNMAFTGVPSTMREEPLETQIFNYGLGAWFGFNGVRMKDQQAGMKKMAKLVREGNPKNSKKQLRKSLARIETMERELKKKATEPYEAERTPGEMAPGKKRGAGVFRRWLSTGYGLMEKMGFGKFTEEGLANTLFLDDVAREKAREDYFTITNHHKRVVGLSKEVDTDIFRWLNGRIGGKKLAEKHGGTVLEVAKQQRRLLNNLLDGINLQRVRNGEKPIKKLRNYAAHVWEFYGEGKNSFDERAMYEEFLQTPKRQAFVHEKKRTGGKGYIESTWKMLDIYAYRNIKAANDNFVRQGKQYLTYLGDQVKKHNSGEQVVKFPAENIHRNLKEFIRDYQGNPSSFDKSIEASMQSYNKWVTKLKVPGLRVKNINQLSNNMVNMVYTAQMGFRPKLALRNLGQNMLTIGATGYKPLLGALGPLTNANELAAVKKSLVIASRGGAFVPEAQGMKELTRKSMWMFRQADMKNVTTAFRAGYRQAKAKGASEADAIKRGDYVAGLTQFIYLNGNRSGLGRGLFGRTTRPLSMFTSWPINYIEFLTMASEKGNRANLLKYLTTAAGFIGVTAAAGIKGVEYTGLKSPMALLDFMQGKLPIMGISERPRIQIIEDIRKVLKDDDLRQLLFYTFKED